MKMTGHPVRDTPDRVSGVRSATGHRTGTTALPLLVTIPEVADLLRTTPTAVYAMVARDQLPGVTRLGRRVLIRSADLLDWLDQKRAPSPGGRR